MILHDIELIGGVPAFYLRAGSALCIADLHLGYEEALMASSGIALPSGQLKDVEHKLEVAITNCEPRPWRLIINGDLKHVFAESSRQEWYEVPLFIQFALQYFREIILVRGNHDTYLGPLKRFGSRVKIVNTLSCHDFLFMHGHNRDFDEIISSFSEGQRSRGTIVIAHEHPIIVLGDRVGARVRLPCFLVGEPSAALGGMRVVVMPAFSPLAGGTPVNLASKDEFLSPILRSPEVDTDRMEVYAVDEAAGIMAFPHLWRWKRVSLSL